VVELPADLVLDGFRPIRVRKADGSDGVSGGTECVRAHVADGYGLTGGSGSSCSGGSDDITRADATGEPTTDLLRRVQLTPGEGAGPRDQRPRAIIIRSLVLKQPKNSLNAV
jgi:hypothetical protein